MAYAEAHAEWEAAQEAVDELGACGYSEPTGCADDGGAATDKMELGSLPATMHVQAAGVPLTAPQDLGLDMDWICDLLGHGKPTRSERENQV